MISSGIDIIDSPLSKISIEANGSLGTSSKVPDSILSLRSDKHLICDNVLGFCPITIFIIGISSGIPLYPKSINNVSKSFQVVISITSSKTLQISPVITSGISPPI